MKVRDAYRILEVPPGSGSAVVRRSYRSLLKKHHPDLSGVHGSAAQLERVIEAFRFLVDNDHLTPDDSDESGLHQDARRSRAEQSGRASRRSAQGGSKRGPANEARGPANGARNSYAGTGYAGTGYAAGREDPWEATRKAGDSGGGSRRESGGRNDRMDVFDLGELVVSAERPETRAFAAKSLGNSGKRWTVAFLRAALNDSSELVVISAVRALGRLKVVQCAGEFASLFFHGGDDLRHAILDSIEESGRATAFRSVIVEALKVSDGEVRRRALRLFAQSRREEAQ